MPTPPDRDLVERLQEWDRIFKDTNPKGVNGNPFADEWDDLEIDLREAASEVTRLRGQVEQLREALVNIKRAQTAADHGCLHKHTGSMDIRLKDYIVDTATAALASPESPNPEEKKWKLPPSYLSNRDLS